MAGPTLSEIRLVPKGEVRARSEIERRSAKTRRPAGVWQEGRRAMNGAIYPRATALAALALVLVACAATSSEEQAQAAKVRVVTSSDFVRGCDWIGTITDNEIPDLQKKAARLGGNVALVTMQTQGGRGGFGYSSGTYTTADVYRCGGGR